MPVRLYHNSVWCAEDNCFLSSHPTLFPSLSCGRVCDVCESDTCHLVAPSLVRECVTCVRVTLVILLLPLMCDVCESDTCHFVILLS